jgi:hypothetical protein
VSEKSLPVARSAKKSAVKERTLAERKYCAIDQFYYSEMFTCPICYGADRERERLAQLFRSKRCECMYLHGEELTAFLDAEDDNLKHMNCDWVELDWVIEEIEGVHFNAINDDEALHSDAIKGEQK